MTYYVIGLMSGSSLDGLDVAYTQITYNGGKWEYEIPYATCIPYNSGLKEKLKNAAAMSVPEFVCLDTAFGRFCAEQVTAFIDAHDLKHKVFFIASHGHTVWHDPKQNTSVQIGDGASIAALTGYTTITDLRNMDVALGGQGAPIVPMTDRLLFSDFDFCLNLGGIANVTINRSEPLAFDICPANQLLDYFAAKKGCSFDAEGALARAGTVSESIIGQLNRQDYYRQPPPKSLDNDFSKAMLPLLAEESPENALATAVQHIVEQIVRALTPYCEPSCDYKMLLTGGGALNQYLTEQLEATLAASRLPVQCILPENNLIHYKEALAMCLMGVLRWREEENVLASVTGARRNSIGGALWLGA